MFVYQRVSCLESNWGYKLLFQLTSAECTQNIDCNMTHIQAQWNWRMTRKHSPVPIPVIVPFYFPRDQFVLFAKQCKLTGFKFHFVSCYLQEFVSWVVSTHEWWIVVIYVFKHGVIIWLFNIAMERSTIFNRWTIYFYDPSIPWLC